MQNQHFIGISAHGDQRTVRRGHDLHSGQRLAQTAQKSGFTARDTSRRHSTPKNARDLVEEIAQPAKPACFLVFLFRRYGGTWFMLPHDFQNHRPVGRQLKL